MNNEVCGNCKWNRRVFDGHCNSAFCCGKVNGDYEGCPTAYDDTCDDYEEKE